jgi:hypothetical protein
VATNRGAGFVLEVESDPEGADIYLDWTLKGKTGSDRGILPRAVEDIF